MHWAALDYRQTDIISSKHALATPWMGVHAINLPMAEFVRPLFRACLSINRLICPLLG